MRYVASVLLFLTVFCLSAGILAISEEGDKISLKTEEVSAIVVEVTRQENICEYDDGVETYYRTIVKLDGVKEEVLCGDLGDVNERIIIELPITHRLFNNIE